MSDGFNEVSRRVDLYNTTNHHHNNTTENSEEAGDEEELSRSTSAPPVLELAMNQLFSSQDTSEPILNEGDLFRYGFKDIRMAPEYSEFYSQSQHQQQLPPPLSIDFFSSYGNGLSTNGHPTSKEGRGRPIDDWSSTQSLFDQQRISNESKHHRQQHPGMNGFHQQNHEQHLKAVGAPKRQHPQAFPNHQAHHPHIGSNSHLSKPIPIKPIRSHSNDQEENLIWSSFGNSPSSNHNTKQSNTNHIHPSNGASNHPLNTNNNNSNSNVINSNGGIPISSQEFNRGKHAIHKAAKMSSSTEDLLYLAGNFWRMREGSISSQEGGSQSPALNRKMRNFSISSPRSKEEENQQPSSTAVAPPQQQQQQQSLVNDSKTGQRGPLVQILPHQGVNQGVTQPVSLLHQHQGVPQSSLPPIQQQQTMPIITGSTKPCRYFSAGYCSRGENCNFLHIRGDLPNQPNYPTILSQPRSSPKKVNNFSSPSRYSGMTIEDCIGNIYYMCKDQHGCRFLQKKLDTDTAVTVSNIFAEVIDNMVELMSDPFGNYLCQKLLEHCTPQQRLAVVKSVSSKLVMISKNMHGTRAVQKMIDHLRDEEEINIVSNSLKGSVVELIQDLNGNHVIQRCLQKMEPIDNQFIYDAVSRHVVVVSTHRHGCCVMQRCIDHSTEEQKRQLTETIQKNALTLVKDPFGNYVVQYILDLNMEDVCDKLGENLAGNIFELSTQKFSSNVIEKILQKGETRTIMKITRELITASQNSQDKQSQNPILRLLQDAYGNYVIQTALVESSIHCPREFTKLANQIRPLLAMIRNTPYVKRIQSKITQGQRNIQQGIKPGINVVHHENGRSFQQQGRGVGRNGGAKYHGGYNEHVHVVGKRDM